MQTVWGVEAFGGMYDDTWNRTIAVFADEAEATEYAALASSEDEFHLRVNELFRELESVWCYNTVNPSHNLQHPNKLNYNSEEEFDAAYEKFLKEYAEAEKPYYNEWAELSIRYVDSLLTKDDAFRLKKLYETDRQRYIEYTLEFISPGDIPSYRVSELNMYNKGDKDWKMPSASS